MIDAVILDLGNVLVFHDDEQLYQAMAQTFRVSTETLRAHLDQPFWERVNRGQLPGDQLRLALLESFDVSLDPESWMALWNCHFTVNEAMITVVERLVGLLPVVLLSNTHDQHFAYLHSLLPVLDRFQGLVLSYEQGSLKPEAAIYRRALELAGVAAHRTAFFDDVERYTEAATFLGIHGRVFSSVDRFLSDLQALGISDDSAQIRLFSSDFKQKNHGTPGFA